MKSPSEQYRLVGVLKKTPLRVTKIKMHIFIPFFLFFTTLTFTSGQSNPPYCSVCETSQRLWLEHVFWTREVIYLTLNKLPNDASVSRLLQNQVDLGNWFGNQLKNMDVGVAITNLLQTHIKQALAIVIGVRDGKDVTALLTAWKQNARDIASALSKIGHQYGIPWQFNDIIVMMSKHLELTTQEVLAMNQKKWMQSVEIFEQVEKEIIDMSNLFTNNLGYSC